MKTVSEENKENPSVGNTQPISDLLMKPFSLGWTREVVRRVVTHCGTPNCDIYYFNPNKKKLRSLTEVKSNLTDGLSVECFSFKREPLGLSPDLETVRDAKVRGKGVDKPKEKRKVPAESLKKPAETENPEEEANDSGRKAKRRKMETATENSEPDCELTETEEKLNDPGKKTKKKKTETEDSQPDSEPVEAEDKSDADHNRREEEEEKGGGGEEEEVKKDSGEDTVTKPRRTKSEGKDSKENKSFINTNRTKTKRKSSKPSKPVRLQPGKRRKSALKRVMSAKQAKQAAGRKTLKGVVPKKKVVGSPKRKLSSKAKSEKKPGLKAKKNSSAKLKAGKRPVKNSLAKGKGETAKAPETNDTDKKSVARDLKSIVKKNIGKYREMREKQKLGAVKNQARNPSRKLTIANVPRSRSEPISKNKTFYLKPLEKGWRRELVYRTNCAKAGQQADVYYFHPNGKKLRSCREIAENLTHGLSIDCFTFRKEPIGCGEPSEVIRNARSLQKN